MESSLECWLAIRSGCQPAFLVAFLISAIEEFCLEFLVAFLLVILSPLHS